MSCKDCDKFEKEGKIAYYRWGNANVGIIGCEDHLKEIFEVLDDAQRKKNELKKTELVITKLAHDAWAMAEGKIDASESNLKKISSALHDIRAGRDFKWYINQGLRNGLE